MRGVILDKPPPRTEVLADAAIAVIAAEGLRGLTHRAVEARAGLPAGSTSYYFPSRSALLRGVLARLLDLDWRDFEAFGLVSLPSSREAVVRASVRVMSHLASVGRERQLARYALYLSGDSDPELAEMLESATRAILDRSVDMVRTLGSRHPRRDGRLLVALLDGLLYDEVARRRSSPAELRRRLTVVLDAVLPELPV
jgi:DNA-binding transcriptional regulator YbjK